MMWQRRSYTVTGTFAQCEPAITAIERAGSGDFEPRSCAVSAVDRLAS